MGGKEKCMCIYRQNQAIVYIKTTRGLIDSLTSGLGNKLVFKDFLKNLCRVKATEISGGGECSSKTEFPNFLALQTSREGGYDYISAAGKCTQLHLHEWSKWSAHTHPLLIQVGMCMNVRLPPP